MQIQMLNGYKILIEVEDADFQDGVFNFSEDVDVLAKDLFSKQGKLKKITLPKKVTVIKENTFYACLALESINLDNVIIIEELAFSACQGLTSVSLTNAQKIGKYAFVGCEQLIKANLNSNHFHFIEAGLFLNCKNLKVVVLSGRLFSIDYSAFWGCKSLQHIIIDAENAEDYERVKKLLPENLRSRVNSQEYITKMNVIRKAALEKFESECRLNNLPAHITIEHISSWANRAEIVQLRKAWTSVALPIKDEDFPTYRDALEKITQNHINHSKSKYCLYKLKNYLHVLEKAPLLNLFSEKRPGIKTKVNVHNTVDLLNKLINCLENCKTVSLNNHEKELIKERPILLNLIPQSLQADWGLNYSLTLSHG